MPTTGEYLLIVFLFLHMYFNTRKTVKQECAAGLYYFHARYYDPGMGRFIKMKVDTNQLLYPHNAVSSGSYGERAWAQNQLDLGLFYKEVVPKNAGVERHVKGKVELSLILNTALEVSATDDNVELIFSYGVNGKIGVEDQIKEFRMDNNGNIKGSFDIGMSKGFSPKVIDRDWGADFQKEYTTDDIYPVQLPAYDLKGAPHPDQALLFALWAHYSITRGIYEKIHQK
ncbi:hypothetical protein [Paenibacillus mesotrionivorans]|uniref:Uncharacterized protein n=1 Tax=Paenibacillus mesotrionivorans TaxID=3160968 RepID=A0ACC7P5Q8_9BACL